MKWLPRKWWSKFAKGGEVNVRAPKDVDELYMKLSPGEVYTAASKEALPDDVIRKINGNEDTIIHRVGVYVDMYPAHTPTCAVRVRASEFFTPLESSNGEGHCLSCHCDCNPNGPYCNHWIGCPGC